MPDDLYRAVRPMLAVSRRPADLPVHALRQARLLLRGLGQRRRRLAAHRGPRRRRSPRITPDFLAEERRSLGESWFRQEYCCSFEALEGLVYPDFARCVVPGPAPPGGQRVAASTSASATRSPPSGARWTATTSSG